MHLRLAFCGVLSWTLLAPSELAGAAPAPPVGLVAYAGDQSVIVHWDRSPDATVNGYYLYGGPDESGPFTLLSTKLLTPGFAHLQATNGMTQFYRVRAVNAAEEQSADSAPVSAAASAFANDDAFLDYLQRACFDYFWYLANPTNGLVPDRSTASSPCSIAAVGFGLSAITVGIDHGWITRAQGRSRVRLTLQTFWDKPQGAGASGIIGYRGWFYHFLDMRTAARTWACELSSIDTALFLAGAVHARGYFDGTDPEEVAIRSLADALLGRLDWNWMRNGQDTLTMGWKPESGFLTSRWVGYNEGMLLYLLGLGAATNPLPKASWTAWTAGYTWRTNYGYAFVPFPPLFGHQYSHCWVDFRHTADAFMRGKASSYFENSRRATLAQQAYCVANPSRYPGYSSRVWGITACDGPGVSGIAGYNARGAPPVQNDDGTLAPTAVGGSVPFAPEVCIPTLRYLYDTYRQKIWTSYGFRDAFNLRIGWWDPDTLGIDQGPIVLMIENHRSQRVWRRIMEASEIRRGLEQAGFLPLPLVPATIAWEPRDAVISLRWEALTDSRYQVEFSPDLGQWWASPVEPSAGDPGFQIWVDPAPSASAPMQFYRVRRYGP